MRRNILVCCIVELSRHSNEDCRRRNPPRGFSALSNTDPSYRYCHSAGQRRCLRFDGEGIAFTAEVSVKISVLGVKGRAAQTYPGRVGKTLLIAAGVT